MDATEGMHCVFYFTGHFDNIMISVSDMHELSHLKNVMNAVCSLNDNPRQHASAMEKASRPLERDLKHLFWQP